MTTMQTNRRTTNVERMLESADHLIEKHRVFPAMRQSVYGTPHLPEGWVLYSARYEADGIEKGWHVQFLDTTRPFHTDSIVDAWHNESLDTALRKARDIASGSSRLA